jgi:hypothetical protein
MGNALSGDDWTLNDIFSVHDALCKLLSLAKSPLRVMLLFTVRNAFSEDDGTLNDIFSVHDALCNKSE